MVFLVSRVRDGFSLTPPAGDTHSPRQMLILFSVDSPTVLPNSAILRIAGRARRVCLLCRRGGEGSLGIPLRMRPRVGVVRERDDHGGGRVRTHWASA